MSAGQDDKGQFQEETGTPEGIGLRKCSGTESDLSGLVIRNSFRMKGKDTSRTD